jgi:transposase
MAKHSARGCRASVRAFGVLWLRRATEKRDVKTRGICKRLKKVEQALWTFLTVTNVELTNNIAERAVRPAVIVRKTSFGSNSTVGANYFARILSALGTLRMQKRKVFDFLENTLRAAREGLFTPSLVRVCDR